MLRKHFQTGIVTPHPIKGLDASPLLLVQGATPAPMKNWGEVVTSPYDE
jgi:hypothetical protein